MDVVVAILNVTGAVDPGVSETLETLNEIEGPFATTGDIEEASDMVPVKWRLLTERIDAEYPPMIITPGLTGPLVIAKSPITVTDSVAL